MPGPKMGSRPPDFDEQLIRQSPTFIKWSQLEPGVKLRYACREFVKGHGDDEERLMRRIMIARRNNIRDHQTLKRARQVTSTTTSSSGSKTEATGPEPNQKQPKLEQDCEATRTRKRRPSTLFSDAEVAKEMDVAAVEATRSYRVWSDLEDGAVFVYNQKYVKGREGHDWLLRKNIWRRMRYRRENKKMVEKLRETHPESPTEQQQRAQHHRMSATVMASQIVDQTLLHHHPASAEIQVPSSVHPIVGDDTDQQTAAAAAAAAAASPNPPKLSEVDSSSISEAVEAAVAIAQSYAKSAHYTSSANTNIVHNPLEGAVNNAALDAAARLAATANLDEEAVAAAAAAAAQPTQYGDNPGVTSI